MLSLFTSLHLVNLKQSELQHTVEVDCVKLRTKYNCQHGQYSSAKSEYFQSQCSKCEQQWKIKQNIKCADKLLRKYKCLFLSWDLNQPLILFLSNGSIVNMQFNDKNNTLLKVDIDNNLCGKFLPCRIVDVIISKNCIYLTYVEPKLTLIYINHDSPSLFGKIFGQKKGKLKPKIVNFDLYVHNAKSLERKLSLNIEKDLLLVWWRNCSDDVWPWTPIAYLTDRVNMLLYLVNGICVELLCSIKVQGDLLHASFSKEHSNQFFTLEEIKKEGEIIVNVCIHEIIHGNCQLTYATKLPLKGSLIAFHWSSTEDKLLAADSGGLLLVYDVKKKSTIITNLEILPKHLSWHPQNCIALIVGRNNHILCFDAALNIINFKLCYKTSMELKCLELGSYIYGQFKNVQKVLWQESVYNDTCLLLLDSELSSFVFLKFSFGFITRYNITTYEIISQYLKSNSLDKAILVLESLNWCYKSDVKFQCLSKIVNCLLRKSLNFHTQAVIELALGAFYDCMGELPEKIVEIYQVRMHHLARRFFHHLLRYYKFRKAFLLAVELEAQDLFFDLHHVAKQKGETILAGVALLKAEEFDDSSESSEPCSSDCHSDSSYCNDITYTGSYQNNPRDDMQIPCNKELRSSHLSIQTKKQLANENKERYSSNSVNEGEIESRHIQNVTENSVNENIPGTQIITVGDNSVIEEENEEVEGTRIKLAHLGVI